MQKRILLCDDEIHILRAAEFKFSRGLPGAMPACNGEEAWGMIEQQVPDVLVTDCQMPLLTGLELARRIKEHPATSHLPIIMLSAKGFELSSTQLRKDYGIVKLLCKPFSPRELFGVVESLLEHGSETSIDPLVALPVAVGVPPAVSQWL